ncbi:non-homologous end-joining DNA ligase [Pedobacter sp. SYP-B3415]|uniref:non-homologous end-joining DNA ligase n=1 Tax=Pedobacter sp. SYP-B3415 TaxID=2496641 RepID=UPI00197DCCD2|nr:non-homologous end-joining DNA ligase [Pedobacter sp. SYP-B3415]
MALKEYHKKRDFTKTSEPKAGKSDNKTLRFVIQRHHASRLHYDFRLELDGVLKSWAVPKGPSLNPADKRLAMMVEDHPYDYRTFEGTIPMGHYGGGTVSIFDSGTYKALDADIKSLRKGLKEGNLKFSLNGKKMKGEFALVKIHAREGEQDNAWLLIKHRDKFATDAAYDAEDHVRAAVKKAGIEFKKKAASPEKKPKKADKQPVGKHEEEPAFPDYKPMLATLVDALPKDDPSVVFEKKYDGYRIGAAVEKGKVTLISRNGQDYTNMYEVVAKSLKSLGADALLDGEMVAEDASGQSRFQALQNYDAQESNTKLKYYVFDLLYLNGHDLTGLPLLKRKDLLKALLGKFKSQSVKFSEHVTGGEKLFSQAGKEGWEGVIAKRDESYRSGKRSDSWMKIKLSLAQEAVIIGYTKPEGGRNYFRSLVLGMHKDDELVYIGNCGSGFTDKSLKELYNTMHAIEQKTKPVTGKVTMERKIAWLKPELVCEVTFSEWTEDGHMRHPVFKGLRPDKKPVEVKQEKAGPASKEQDSPKQNAVKKEATKDENLKFGAKSVKLTNLQKVYWPKEKITKESLSTITAR